MPLPSKFVLRSRTPFSVQVFALAMAAAVAAGSVGYFGFSPVLAQEQAEPTESEVKAFIEQQVQEGFPADEVVAAALELGYRPELIARAMLSLGVEPVQLAIILVREGIPREQAAKSVIREAGQPSEDPVRKAILNDTPPEERPKVEEAVNRVIEEIKTQPQDPPPPAPQPDPQPQTDPAPAPQPEPPPAPPPAQPPIIPVNPLPVPQGGGGSASSQIASPN
jgi:hypothetical protein